MIELPPWLKIGELVAKLDFSGWFSGRSKSDNRRFVTGGSYIERMEIHTHTPTSTAGEDAFTKGLYALGLDKNQLDAYGEFLNGFYKEVENKHKRQITRNALTMLRGAVFAVGTSSQNNPEWKEHCASSLREIFHEWDGKDEIKSDIASIYNHNNSKGGLTIDENRTLAAFWLLYRYFSAVDHHEASGAMHSLQEFKKDDSVKIENCMAENIFLDTAKDFFAHLSRIMEISRQRSQL
ncbi:MAG: hypothetical protein UV55_C0023G0002 [Candidatus Gottesmanbacteria bacterium GW2011_GWC1_43_10]|nr:MAG: hypothetical protein UV55_C0023G0002 [Candidatus Gottesmanbacteria bacterium GW2011_GWC1_43_10]